MRTRLLTMCLVAAVGAAGLTACESETDGQVEAKVSEPDETDGEKAVEGEDGDEAGAAAKADGAEAGGEGDAAAGAELEIDPENSKIEWVGAKITGDHTGGFKKYEGHVYLNEAGDGVEKLDFTVDTTSIFSDTEKLTGHLKSEDFFHVEEYPKATFTSTEIKKGSDAEPKEGAEPFTHTITGTMDLHGVEKKITFPARVDISEDKVNASTKFNINRFDFDMKYKGKPDDLIKKEVLFKIGFEAPLKKKG